MKKCEVCGKSEGRITKSNDKLLCFKHYQQYRKHGEAVVTRFDKNEITVNDLYAEMIIVKNTKNHTVIFSKQHVKLVSQYKWHINDKGYVIGTINNKNVRLHRLITSATKGDVVDHRNGNKLDNTDENLRICKQKENIRNKNVLPKHNTSGFMGVYYHKKAKKWCASIQIDNKSIYLGLYEDLEKAKEVRLQAEKKYFGDFSPNRGGDFNDN